MKAPPGRAHPDTLAAAISLTNLQRTTGQTADALELAQDGGDLPQCLPSDHPYNYGFLGNLALLYRLPENPTRRAALNESALSGPRPKAQPRPFLPLTVAVAWPATWRPSVTRLRPGPSGRRPGRSSSVWSARTISWPR